jgi:hypothetical protein
LKKTRDFVRRKVGRPPAALETVQVGLRLPKVWVEQFQRGRGVSKEIQERLFQSFFDDATDPKLREFWGQLEQLAVDVRRAFGAEWHDDQKAHLAFIDAVRRLIADLPVPTEQVSTLNIEPSIAGQLIYNQYLATIRDLKEGRVAFRATARQQMGDDDEQK